MLSAPTFGPLPNLDDGSRYMLHIPWWSPVLLFLFWSPFSMVASMVGHPHDHRAHAVILDCAPPDNERVRDAIVHKHVCLRRLEVIEAVEHERVITRGSWR